MSGFRFLRLELLDRFVQSRGEQLAAGELSVAEFVEQVRGFSHELAGLSTEELYALELDIHAEFRRRAGGQSSERGYRTCSTDG